MKFIWVVWSVMIMILIYNITKFCWKIPNVPQDINETIHKFDLLSLLKISWPFSSLDLTRVHGQYHYMWNAVGRCAIQDPYIIRKKIPKRSCWTKLQGCLFFSSAGNHCCHSIKLWKEGSLFGDYFGMFCRFIYLSSKMH